MTDNTIKCPHCGNFHGPKCPLVKAVEYHENGSVKRVEYFAPNDYPALQSGAFPGLPLEGWKPA